MKLLVSIRERNPLPLMEYKTIWILVICLICVYVSPRSAEMRSDTLFTTDDFLMQRAQLRAGLDTLDIPFLIDSTESLLEKARDTHNCPDSLTAMLYRDLSTYYFVVREFEISADYNELWISTLKRSRSPSAIEMIDYYDRIGHCKYWRGSYNAAESLFTIVLTFKKEHLSPDDPRLGMAYYKLGGAYIAQNKFKEGDALLDSSIYILRGTDEIWYDSLLGVLESKAYSFFRQHKYADAESLYTKTLNLAERSVGENSIELISLLINLAEINMILANYGKGESFLNRALSICEGAKFCNSRYQAWLLTDIGMIHQFKGQLDNSEHVLKEALNTIELASGKETGQSAYIMLRLSKIFISMKKYKDALSFGEKGLSILEQVLNEHHHDIAFALATLAEIHTLRGEYDAAMPLFIRARTIAENVQGKEEIIYQISYREAYYYYCLGDYDHAIELMAEAVRSCEQIFGSQHPSMSHHYSLMALLYAAKNECKTSREWFRRMLEVRRSFLKYVFSYSSSAQKLRWLNEYTLISDAFLTSAVDSGDPQTIRDALLMILMGKGIVLDALVSEKAAVYCTDDSHVMIAQKALRDLRERIAYLTVASQVRGFEIEARERLLDLYDREDSLESQLSQLCAEIHNLEASQNFEIRDVASSLPHGGVLWEYVRFQRYEFSEIGNERDRLGGDRYLVFTLDDLGNIDMYDLGPAEVIDSLIELAREMVYSAGQHIYSPLLSDLEDQLGHITQQLYKLVFEPPAAGLGDRTEIYVCPDGLINLIPLDVLQTRKKDYVIERFRISYLSSGRDLINVNHRGTSAEEAIIMADPNYDTAVVGYLGNVAGVSDQIDFSEDQVQFLFRSMRSCMDNAFHPLPYSRLEGESIASNLGSTGSIVVNEYYGVDANEVTIKNLSRPPYILHIATHGIFCENYEFGLFSDVYNPLAISGLALAGINGNLKDYSDKRPLPWNDGILLSTEIADLRLIGTELVTISGCETGLGDLVTGEGIFGLRRAFQLAGAQSLVMSLWPVPDRETGSLLSGFYEHWMKGVSKSEALRTSALEILSQCRKEMGSGHPIFWGGFVLFGISDNPLGNN